MPRPVRIDEDENGLVVRFESHRRTITETDIVNFVNLVGLHEAPFIDMEYVGKMPGIHNKRFAPAPLLISLGMGLVATSASDVVDAISDKAALGHFHGMIGVEAAVKHPVFPGDTLKVDLAGRVDRTTSRGQTIVALEHVMKNQLDDVVVVFTERIIFDPAA